MPENTLYYGDNLDVLTRYIKDETVDLVYLDPPFNSNATYNVLFAEKDGSKAASQIKAFDDTWHWNLDAQDAYEKIVERGGKVADAMMAFHTLLGDNDMMAYLAMMAPRLVGLRRVLKPTGSIYLHCDPTASHYLKLLMDAVFGAANYKNEIIWKRTTAHSNVYNCYGDVTDTILFYGKIGKSNWNQVYKSFEQEDLEKLFPNIDKDGRRWKSENMRNPGIRPNLHYSYAASNGITYKPHPNGWTVCIERMKQLDLEGRLHFPTKPEGRLRLKFYADEWPGVKLQNLWDDIPPIGAQAAERLGYPTQKPLPLLDRIIKASSNEGDVVLDPFCGCGTTIDAAQRLNRTWIGIDITHLAITLIKHRLRSAYGESLQFKTIGEPADLASAETLAKEDPYQFQFWSLGLVGARPAEQKKGADRGIDGKLNFHDEKGGKTKQIIFSVKAGKVQVSHVRDLRGVLDREKAEIGVLISMNEPTREMVKEAVSAGFYTNPWSNEKHPRIQILTISELLDGRKIDYPGKAAGEFTFKEAQKIRKDAGEEQGEMF